MKIFIFILLFPIFVFSQDKIDPLPIITDTTGNYSIIDPVQHDFFLGWNWGTPGRKLDDALLMNMYHGYPTAGSINDDDYADNIHIVQALEGNVISGRPSTATFNSQSLYLEPTIKVIHPDGPVEFQPNLRNQNGAVFGFQKKSDEIRYKNDPLNPDFGRVFLYKDSMTALPKVVLDSIWSSNILRFYNYVDKPILNLDKLNGKELFVSINLKALEPITPINKNNVVLTIRLPYKVWNDTINNKAGGYIDSNYVKFKNLPKVSGVISDDTIRIYDSRGDFRGIRRDTDIALSPGVREFQITAKMLDALGNGLPNVNITLSAFAYFNNIDTLPNGDYKWNPILRPDWHDHGVYKEYINDLDVEVTYHGNLDVAIDWIRLETPRAREIYDGKYDNDIYDAAKAMMDEIADEPYHDPKLYKFYVSDELLPHQWGVNRYLNLLLDTLGASETTLSKNPAGHFLHSTLFKEYWTGDNIRFLNEQATPAIEYGLTRDSLPIMKFDTTYDVHHIITKIDTTHPSLNESPESLNYLYGFKGRYHRKKYDLLDSLAENPERLLNDSLNSDYETFIHSGSLAHKTLPFPSNHWPYDSLYKMVADGHEYYLSSTQFQTEFLLKSFYKDHSRMLFDNFPWWANLWVISETWERYFIKGVGSTYSIDKPGHRPKTGEEINLMVNEPLILGAKGLLYWFKTEGKDGKALGMQNYNNLGYIQQLALDTLETLLYSNKIGGDFIQTHDPFININKLNKSQLRLNMFGHDSNRVYIGIKSLRTQLYKTHKWINALDDELMDLRLQAWHGKGFKEWEVWNQYNDYQYWGASPLRRIVNVDSIRTRKLFEPKSNFIHNSNPDNESKDSSFFDVTLLQDKSDSPSDLYNRKKSVYLGIQNRRSDPLIFRDSIDINPINNFGELMFFSSAEMDSNVRFGGKDLWGINQSANWWKNKWWQRLGVRELSLPISIPVYGNGTYLIAEELGLEKMDTLGWWFANDLYHRIDTVLNSGDKLLAKLLPGQGKIIKLTYVPYFFNDPTKDSDTTNDHCYFCDIFNDFSKFEFSVVAGAITGSSCCYDVSFTYKGNCTFEDIPFRVLFTKDSITNFTQDIIELNNPYEIHDSLDLRYKYKDTVMSLNSTTGSVALGTFCLGDSSTGYTISLLAGKDKDSYFIGCDREMSFKVACNYIDKEIIDCCEGLDVTDSLYSTGSDPYTSLYCTKLKIDKGFDSDCIFGVSLGNGDYNKTLIPTSETPLDFTAGSGIEFTLCSHISNCAPGYIPSSGTILVKMQFLGRDGTVICETEVPILSPCISSGLSDLDLLPPTGGHVGLKASNEKQNSKTYESESFKVSVWPNPTSGELNVEIISKVDTEVEINFLSNLGASVKIGNDIPINRGVNAKTYNLKDYSSGVYYLQINSKDGNIVLPIMLNK